MKHSISVKIFNGCDEFAECPKLCWWCHLYYYRSNRSLKFIVNMLFFYLSSRIKYAKSQIVGIALRSLIKILMNTLVFRYSWLTLWSTTAWKYCSLNDLLHKYLHMLLQEFNLFIYGNSKSTFYTAKCSNIEQILGKIIKDFLETLCEKVVSLKWCKNICTSTVNVKLANTTTFSEELVPYVLCHIELPKLFNIVYCILYCSYLLNTFC